MDDVTSLELGDEPTKSSYAYVCPGFVLPGHKPHPTIAKHEALRNACLEFREDHIRYSVYALGRVSRTQNILTLNSLATSAPRLGQWYKCSR